MQDLHIYFFFPLMNTATKITKKAAIHKNNTGSILITPIACFVVYTSVTSKGFNMCFSNYDMHRDL